MRIVVLTGAGISAESGVPTFRDADGLWEGHDPLEVATPEAFAADPGLVQRFYDARRAALATVGPNPAHRALADLEAVPGVELTVITQNIDDLHERAGSTDVVHMHGELRSALCLSCGTRSHWEGDLVDVPACPSCGRADLRPDVVWFGEIPYRMDEIEDRLADADLFVSIGTSSVVYPAAGFVRVARMYGARTLELNLDPSAEARVFDETRQGPATRLVPEWVASLVGRPAT
ncbi:NAD-dependent deacylase [Nocardioides rotundus]|uniref:NAD-dependent deacylase n=1 Tax=Nocardioides rotundus TaxID=1774216 RepID=UPI001CBD8B41|nr:NAD-dependent deacylase [Nocardioides rotundus]UAL29567.1 NAD-dependent deacylase [Nocardioides rotundus]